MLEFRNTKLAVIEAELRELWSEPDTRARLLEGLAEKGFGKEQMAEMQKVIDAEKSDLFDVLAHVAYALAPKIRNVFTSFQRFLYQPPARDRQLSP